MRRARRAASAATQLADLADVIIVGVRAGLGLTAAVREAIDASAMPLAGYLSTVDHRLRRGDRLADALAELSDTLGPDAASFVDTLATTDRYGLPLEPALERLAVDSREQRRRAADRYARTLPVRLSFPLVLCTLPSFVLCAIVPAVLGALSDLRDLTP